MAKKKNTEFDVIVVGAGPAGSTVAAKLAGQGMSVGLLDRAKFPRRKACVGWVNTQVTSVLSDLGVATKKLLARPIDEVTFHNGDLSQSSVPKTKSGFGYLVDRATFDERLAAAAKRAGVMFLDGCEVTDLNPLESEVEVFTSKGTKLNCKLLVLAIGASTELRSRVGIARNDSRETRWTAVVEHLADTKAKGDAAKSKIDVVLGVTEDNGFAVLARQRDKSTLIVNSLGERAQICECLVEIADIMREKNLLPPNFSVDPSAVECMESSFGPALELDSHVGKHTLLIGDAGGFVAAVSQEGIYPSMWSAQIAADVIGEAWGADVSQDILMTFDTKWRLAMGDYLRPPNTDLQLLAPLIFSNQPMTDRMAGAFFSGENI